MDDRERIEYIVEMLNRERKIAFRSEEIGEDYDIDKFYELLKKSNGILGDILINGSREVFFETIELALRYHHAEGEYENRNPNAGLNLDMLYRLCNDANEGFVIRNSRNVLDFSKQFRNRVREYIDWAQK